MYSSARLYYIARFTEATLTDPYQTSREWSLTLKNCLSKVQKYTEEKNRGGGGVFLGPLEAQRAFFCVMEFKTRPTVHINDDSFQRFWNVLGVN